MSHSSTEFSARPELEYPFKKGWHPQPAEPFEVADGVFWLRMPMPIALDHINLWLLRDGDGWTIIDSGLDAPLCREVWDRVFAEVLTPESVKQVIITHYHPDHIGLAAWLAHRCQCRILITQGELQRYRALVDRDQESYLKEARAFIGEFGFDDSFQDLYTQFFSVDDKSDDDRVQVLMCDIIEDGSEIDIDTQTWQVVMGNGHSPEHACLFNKEKNVLISGDQVIARISSNISVYLANRDQNPLSDWLNSCQKLQNIIPEDALILPAHQEPFRGIVPRLQQLIDDHHTQLNRLRKHSDKGATVRELTKVLFDRKLSDVETLMAASETLSHVNYLLFSGELVKQAMGDGSIQFKQAVTS